MAQCDSYPHLSCIGTRGSCSGTPGGCLHAKKDREDEERDRKVCRNDSKGGKIGFFGWLLIALFVLYLLR